MIKVISILIFIGCRLLAYSQGTVKMNSSVWEETFGYEKTKVLVQAVADADTTLEICNASTLYNKGYLKPFMVLDNGMKLLFYVQEKNVPIIPKSVDVYSYTDVKLQDHQLRDASIVRRFAVVFDFSNSRLIRLERKGEKLVAKYYSNVSDIQISDQYALIYDFGDDIFTYEIDGTINESYSMAQYSWNKGLNSNVYLISLKDGSRKIIKKNVEATSMCFPFFRLSAKSNYVLSYENHNYYAYNIATGITNCISRNISKSFIRSENFRDFYNPERNVEGWKDSSYVLVRDAFSNVWLFDMSGEKGPVRQPQNQTNQNQVDNNKPNYIIGNIVTEEITWKAYNGKIAKGVLAKPKDFDPRNKYPVVFIYYENRVVKHNDDRPYGIGDFVDYGYLVFSPDINYSIGETGKSVLNYVVSAAEYLKKLPYVDANKMGLRGASFGGYETNYLVTHTNLFAAAISMAGYSDFISNIGAQDNWIRPHQLEGTDQNRLGVTLWERPDIWIKNSPIFYADRVTTPLLLIHSKSDNNVPFEQSLGFFRALRSLGKRSWLLQYDAAGHIGLNTSIVGQLDGNCDMCTRQLQFFNHYLKGAAAPLWMLDGIPARNKGKVTGLELDISGRTPGPGLVKEKITVTNQQEVLLRHKTRLTDDGRIIHVEETKSH